MSDCRNCAKDKLYKACQGKYYYTYGDIRWCRWQIIWLIENYFSIEQNGLQITDFRWVADPAEVSSYTSLSKERPKGEARYCKPAEVLGELELRMKQCPERSVKLLVAEVLSIKAGTQRELCWEAESILKYLSGWRRKRRTYYQWRYDHKRIKEGIES